MSPPSSPRKPRSNPGSSASIEGQPLSPPALELGRELGAGAAGTVHLARLRADHGSWPKGTEVAVKRLWPEVRKDPEALASLATEGNIGRRVGHPSLARVVWAGTDEDGPLLVTEYVEGNSLREVLEESGPLPEPRLRHVGTQLAGALGALHAAGVVHGDVKPENVRLAPSGRAVLVDLGFARAAPDVPDDSGAVEASGLETLAGIGPGSLPYLAPERVRGGGPSPAGDLWALGVTLWELAVGSHPLVARPGVARPGVARPGVAESGLQPGAGSGDGDDADGFGPTGFSAQRPLAAALEETDADRLLAAISLARFAPPSRRAPQLSPFFDRLAAELLAKDPAVRIQATELAQILAEGESGDWWRRAVAERAPGAFLERREGGAHLTPLVGRDRELVQLAELWHGAREGRGAAVLLEAPAGGGKSRLASDLADALRAGEDPPLYLYTRCTELIETQPYGALLVALRRWLQLPAGTPVGSREENVLRSLLSPRAAETLLHQLAPAGGERPADSLSAALTEWLLALTAERSLLVFVDDLRHSGETTLRVLSGLLRRLTHERLMLLVAHREDEPASPALSRFLEHAERTALDADRVDLERLSLPPLDRDAVLELVTQLFHHTTPRLRLAAELWKRSRGNPGLLTEVLRDLVDSGRARPAEGQSGQWLLESAPDELPLPGSLQRTITRRYRQLPAELRFWLRRLAVVGGRIAPDFLVRAFQPVTAEEVGEVLAELVRTGWLAPAGGRYRFARPALREAVYRSLSADRRRRLHTAAARALAAPEGSRTVQRDSSLSVAEEFQRAFHLRAAGEHAQLLRLLVPLLREHRSLGQAQRVHSLARWGIEALDALPAEETSKGLATQFLEAAADAANRLGYREEERGLLDRLADLVTDPAADPAAAARAYLLHGRYAAGTGQYGLARGMLRNAVEFADLAGDRGLASDCLRQLALVQSHVGEVAEARELAREAIVQSQSPEQRALGWLARAQVDVLDDRVESALRGVRRAHAILRHAPHTPPPGIQAAVLMLRSRILRAAGRPLRAHAAARRALRLARLSGERRLEAEAGARLGGVLVDLDRPAVAEAYLRDALYTADEIEDRRGRALAQVWLGFLLWEEDDPLARPSLERAAALAREMGFYRAEAVSLSILARLHGAAGRSGAALEASARAMELLERHGAELLDRIVITGTRALELERSGRAAESRTTVRLLRRRMRQDNARIHDPDLRRDHRKLTTRLLGAVLSAEGTVYPRVDAGSVDEG